jgi:hypothetical protein
VPAELYPQYTTIEYTLPRTVQLHPPVYLFVVDTCVVRGPWTGKGRRVFYRQAAAGPPNVASSCCAVAARPLA